MAIVTDEIWSRGDGSARVTRTYNDQNGALSRIDWTVNSGTITVTVFRTGQPPLTRTASTSGGVNVPAGYTLVQGPKGDWQWPGDPGFQISG
jgi:uncharacterized protein (DUF927 family)